MFFMVNLGACTIHESSGYISKVAPGPLKTCWRSLFWLFQGYQPNHRRIRLINARWAPSRIIIYMELNRTPISEFRNG